MKRASEMLYFPKRKSSNTFQKFSYIAFQLKLLITKRRRPTDALA